jgi:hypothetical protein
VVSKDRKITENRGAPAMKQKYLILNDKENQQFKIQEFAELNKEELSLLCEEAYAYQTLKAALSGGKDALVAALRTNNLYPPGIYAAQIADAVAALLASKDQDQVELFFDDLNLLSKRREAAAEIEELPDETDDLPDETDDLDEMLEDEFDDDAYPEKDELDKMDASLKIADDDYVDSDDET